MSSNEPCSPQTTVLKHRYRNFFLCRNISLLWITRDIVLSMNEPLVLDLTLTMFTNIVSHPKNSIVDERVEGTEYVPVVNCCVL